MQAKRNNIGSWNVRGLGTSVKKMAVFSMLEKYRVELVCLQETHLTKHTAQQFQTKKYQYQYHSVYSSYSRGVSVTVKTGVNFSCRQSSKDELGRYIFLHCAIDNSMYIVANIYIPPPFRLDVMLRLNEFLLDKEGVPIIIVGDFNEILDRELDRFPIQTFSEPMGKSRLRQFLDEMGLLDLWRAWNPGVLQYSCYSATHSTLSRIDMTLGNNRALQIMGKN